VSDIILLEALLTHQVLLEENNEDPNMEQKKGK
jgi:hypothetical protein